MPRFYINSDEARITKADFNLVDVEFIDGTSWKGLEPKRLFPRSGLTRYISLVDADGHEKAIIHVAFHRQIKLLIFYQLNVQLLPYANFLKLLVLIFSYYKAIQDILINMLQKNPLH